METEVPGCWANANVDENYINRKFIDELNYVDKNGNVMFPEGIFHFDWDMNNYGREGDFSPSEGLIPYWDGESKAAARFFSALLTTTATRSSPASMRPA